jgi:hypothetical protein
MAITNSIFGIKSRFFAGTLRIMSGTSTKKFRIFYDPEIFFFIFQRDETGKIVKNSPFDIFDLYHLEKVLKIIYYLWGDYGSRKF